MAKVINSQALEPVNKALGLAGSGDSQTELLDGVVDQTLDMAPIVRRGGTVGATRGIFRGVMRNTHGAADSKTSVWSPYETGAALAVPPFPASVTDQFDLWLLGAMVRRQGGTGGAQCILALQNVRQGFGVTNAGAFVAANERNVIAYWDAAETVDTFVFMSSVSQNPWQRLNMRLPTVSEAGTRVQFFFTSEATAIAEWECNLLYGMFPIALGQDASF